MGKTEKKTLSKLIQNFNKKDENIFLEIFVVLRKK